MSEIKKEWEYELLHEERNPNIDNLISVYKKDRYVARVVFMNDNNTSYSSYRLALFTKPNGDFNIVSFKKTFGVNKLNVIYSNEKRVASIICKSGKLHIMTFYNYKKQIKQITLNNLTKDLTYEQREIVEDYFIKKFSWIRHMKENNILYDVAFNYIIKNKLYSLKKGLVHTYKVPYPIAKKLHYTQLYVPINKFLPTYLPYIKNIENLKDSWLNTETLLVFYDTIKMGRTLNKKVNCSWSRKRLKNEHDKWAQELTEIIYINNNQELNVGEIYKDFQIFSEYNLLNSTKELAIEGKKRKHCVVNYISRVNNHQCGIFSVGEYTLELVVKRHGKKSSLHINQLKGWNNCEAPQKIYDSVEEILKTFNEHIKESDYEINNLNEETFLPF